jgi:galactokinase
VAARLTGAGFGGCTVNLARAELAEAAGRAIVERYGPRGRFWVSHAGAGAGPVPL